MKIPVSIATGMLVLSLFSLPVMAQSPTSRPAPVDEILHKAEHLIAGSEKGRDRLWQAVELLEKADEKFPKDYRILLKLAESWYRLADPEAKIEKTWPMYEKAEEYSRQAGELEKDRPETRYWYGLAQFKRAQKEGGIGAYFATRRGIAAQLEVLRRMPRYDHAGAARVLTLLYTVAPGWSPFGDVKKAIDYGQQAVRLAPDFPLNRLYLARAYEKAGKRQGAAEQYRQILTQGGNRFREEADNRLRELAGPDEGASRESTNL